MKVNQGDSRSISIISSSGVRFFVPYRFYWNGHERPAESVVLTSPADEEREERKTVKGRKSKPPAPSPSGTWEVRAFFLFGEVRDRIREDEAGITVSRTWSVKTTGSGHLGIDVEFDPPPDVASFFPGLHAAKGVPSSPVSFLGEKTSYPLSLFLSLGRKGVLLFSPSAVCGALRGSIGVSRTEIEDEPARLRVELRFPGVEEPAGRIGPRPGDLVPAEDVLVESPGSLEHTHALCLAFSSREEIALHGGAAVLFRVGPAQAAAEGAAPSTAAGLDARDLADALQRTLDSHQHQAGGVSGLRELRDSPWISASAGLGCALALLKLFPGDPRTGEMALRLADFALKGQVPWGFFHESFHIPTGQWRGVRGQAGDSRLSVGQSARIAELVLLLADELARAGRPYEKYFLAGLRFVDFLLDGKGKLSPPGGLHISSSSAVDPGALPGLPGLEVFFPVSLVFARTGHDRYRKALDVLVRRFSGLPWDPFQPPASREGRASDSAGALVAARLFVEMRALGYKPAEPPVTGATAARARAAESARLFASLLVPWIRVGAEPKSGIGQRAGVSPIRSGYLLDTFMRQRLLCAGYETALLLLRLEALTPAEPEKNLLVTLARDCLASASCNPMGTAYVQHTHWDAAGLAGEGSSRAVPGREGAVKGGPGKRGKGVDPSAGATVKIGPVDSRRLATELLAGVRLAEEFPAGP